MPSTKDFGRKILDSKSGTWFEILDMDHAKMAAKTTRTAIAQFFNSFAKRTPHRWFYLVEDTNAEGPKSPVCLAAVPTDLADQDLAPGIATCHVTGFENRNAYFWYEDDLKALAEATGIHLVPNHMGRPTRPKTDMDTQIIDVYTLLAVGPEDLAEFVPEGLTLETLNWDAMKAIRILDGDTPIAFLLEADEFDIYRAAVPENGLELATIKLGKHPAKFFQDLQEEARSIELKRYSGPGM